MPESRSRKKPEYTAPATARKPARLGGSRWVAPVMVTCWVLGLAWIVVYYLLPDLKYMRELGNWNLAVGMGLIGMGFAFSTKWE
ncbi:MAG: cell division protein CrgA [Propionibacteriales bacterium]|nr:cell division protein CrgA [Propionibacteriales bacterium]